MAEVLIVLGIIGIVAETTIQSLCMIFRNKHIKFRIKAFSVASQAWSMAVTNSEITERSSWLDGATRVSNFNAFKITLKLLRIAIATTIQNAGQAVNFFTHHKHYQKKVPLPLLTVQEWLGQPRTVQLQTAMEQTF